MTSYPGEYLPSLFSSLPLFIAQREMTRREEEEREKKERAMER
jgi:hypothetical protein